MAFRVEITRNAERDVDQLYVWVVEHAPERGAAWFNGLERALLSLDHHPDRCPLAPEHLDRATPVRVLRYGRTPHVYLIFFSVDYDANVVRVVHVRHGARQRPAPGDLADR